MRFEGRALPRPARFRLGGVVALEPVFSRALEAVVAPLADHQVAMRVRAVARVDRQGVGQLLGVGQMVGKGDGQVLLLLGV